MRTYLILVVLVAILATASCQGCSAKRKKGSNTSTSSISVSVSASTSIKESSNKSTEEASETTTEESTDSAEESSETTDMSETTTKSSKYSSRVTKKPRPSTSTTECSEEVLSQFQIAVNKFTNNFVYELRRINPTETTTCSPIATLYFLVLLCKYSGKPQQSECLKIFNLETIEQLECALSHLNKLLMPIPKGIEFDVHGSFIFANTQYPLTDKFKQDSKNLLLGQAMNINFNNSVEAVKIINKMVKKVSKKIDYVYTSPSVFDSDTQIVLTSALYFAGHWKIRFNANSNDITKRKFYSNSGKEIEIGYVSQEAVYNYTESEYCNAKVLQIPLSTAGYTVLVIVPKKNLEQTLEKLKLYDIVNFFNKNSEEVDVSLKLPYFTSNVTTTTDTELIVKRITGDYKIFDSSQANFKNIVKGDIPVGISLITQKVEVQNSYNGGPPPAKSDKRDLKKVDFDANRPFLALALFGDIPLFGTIFDLSSQ